jgi:peptidoglycan/LPS O-acetylase OafA/YrhL
MNAAERLQPSPPGPHPNDRSLRTVGTEGTPKDDPALRHRRNNFDLLRLLAAAQVIYFHSVLFLDVEGRGYAALLHSLAAIFPGVPIFFVISGFLVSRSYENSRSTRSYFRKRALRIFPALWVCFGVTLLLLGAFLLLERISGRNFATVGDGFLLSWTFPLWLVGQLTVGQFFEPSVGFGVGNTNPSLWTIPVEIGFYLLVPLMYWLIINHLRPAWSSGVLGGVALLSFVVWYVGRFVLGNATGRDELMGGAVDLPTEVRILAQTPLPYLYWFIIGALMWRHRGAVGRWASDRVLLWTAGYALLAYAPIWFEAEWVLSTFGYQLALAIGLAMWSMSFALSYRGASHRLLRGLDLSYGLYLFHMLVINVLVELGLGGAFPWVLLVYVVTAALAWMSWKFVEEPVLARKDLVTRRRPLLAPERRQAGSR